MSPSLISDVYLGKVTIKGFLEDLNNFEVDENSVGEVLNRILINRLLITIG